LEYDEIGISLINKYHYCLFIDYYLTDCNITEECDVKPNIERINNTIKEIVDKIVSLGDDNFMAKVYSKEFWEVRSRMSDELHHEALNKLNNRIEECEIKSEAKARIEAIKSADNNIFDYDSEDEYDCIRNYKYIDNDTNLEHNNNLYYNSDDTSGNNLSLDTEYIDSDEDTEYVESTKDDNSIIIHDNIICGSPNDEPNYDALISGYKFIRKDRVNIDNRVYIESCGSDRKNGNNTIINITYNDKKSIENGINVKNNINKQYNINDNINNINKIKLTLKRKIILILRIQQIISTLPLK